MTRALTHLRSNAVAYLALFVALGGTTYAATNLPANSVGARQIKNHSITGVKLDPRGIAASVRFWATVDANGKVVASRPRATVTSGVITWGRRIPSTCLPQATVNDIRYPGGFASTFLGDNQVGVQTFAPGGAPVPLRVSVVVLCP